MPGRIPTRVQIRRLSLFVCCTLGLCCPQKLLGDGGIIQFRKQAGPFLITLFSTPAPLHAGPADLSVLVESASDRRTLLDAKVTLHLRHAAGHGRPNILEVEATRAQATNKLLYAALPDLAEQGLWNVEVDVQEGTLRGSALGVVKVLARPPALLADWPYFALVPLCIALFVLNQYLRRRHLARVRATRTRFQ